MPSILSHRPARGLTGLVLAILSITGFELDVLWALIGVLVVGFFSTFVRYLMAKKRG